MAGAPLSDAPAPKLLLHHNLAFIPLRTVAILSFRPRTNLTRDDEQSCRAGRRSGPHRLLPPDATPPRHLHTASRALRNSRRRVDCLCPPLGVHQPAHDGMELRLELLLPTARQDLDPGRPVDRVLPRPGIGTVRLVDAQAGWHC